MKIAHVSSTFPPYQGGTGNVCYYNARELAQLGHEVTVYTAWTHRLCRREVVDSFTVQRLNPLISYGNAVLIPTLFSALKSSDLIHLHMPFYGGSEAVYLLRKMRGKPLVITHHQDVKLRGLVGLISRAHDYLLGQRLMCDADTVCFTSLDYARHSKFTPLIERGKMRVTEMPNGVDLERFQPASFPRNLAASLGIKGQRVLLQVAALDRSHYFKGVPILLKAVARLNRQDITVVLVGKGDMVTEYKNLANELGLGEQVLFVGYVPDAELPDYYRLADVTLLPSITQGEAFGLVLVESMACSTPVIASNLPGVRTVVTDGYDGFLVEPGSVDDLASKISHILSLPPHHRREMGHRGRLKVEERYGWKQIASRLEALYVNTLADHRRSHTTRREVDALHN